MTDGAEGSLLGVDRDPLFADGANLVEVLKLTGVEYFDRERAVEAFDVRVLCQTTGLGELPFDVVGLGPRLHNVAAELRTIVTAHGIR